LFSFGREARSLKFIVISESSDSAEYNPGKIIAAQCRL